MIPAPSAPKASLLKRLFLAWPFWLAALLLAAGQAVFLGLSLVSLDKFEAESARLVEDSVLETQVDRLAIVATLGVAPAAYLGLPEEARRVAARSGADLAAIVDPEGLVLASYGVGAPDRLSAPPATPGQTASIEGGNRKWRARPVFDPDGRLWGQIVVSVKEKNLGDKAFRLAETAVGGAGLLALLISAALTGLALAIGVRLNASGKLSRLRLYALILTPFLLGQAVFSVNSFPDLANRRLELARERAGQVIGNLAMDLDRVAAKGVDLAKIADLESHLKRLLNSAPEAAAFFVSAKGLLISSPPSATPPEASLIVSTRLSAGGLVEAWLSPSALMAAKIDLGLDCLFLTLVTALALIEMARVLTGDLAARLKMASQKTGPPLEGSFPLPSKEPAFRLERLRLTIFFAIMAVDLPLAFAPLKMAALTKAGSFVSREVLLGLPVALAAFLTGAGLLLSGRLATGKWVLRLATIGLVIAAFGSFLSALSKTPLAFVGAAGLTGFGYGLLNLPFNIIAASSLGPERRGEAFSDITASFFAGGTCGCLIGGLLADRFGFDFVFGLAAAIFLAMALSWRWLSPVPASLIAAFPAKSGGGLAHGLWVFLTRKRPLGLILLSVFPICAATVALVNYYLPLRLFDLGFGPAMAGRLNFLMSILIVVLAPKFGRAMDKSGKTALFLMVAGLFAALSSLSYLAIPTLLGAILAAIFIGLAQSVTESGHSAALMGLPESEKIGANNALGLASAFNRASQATGPVLLGGALGALGLFGLAAFGGAIAVLSLGYGAFFGGRPKTEP
jgi:MFS family permease